MKGVANRNCGSDKEKGENVKQNYKRECRIVFFFNYLVIKS